MTITALYADGGVIGSNPSPLGGTWAWCLVDEAGARVVWESGLVTPAEAGGVVTNNVTELAALVYGLEALPIDFRGTVYSDSQVTLLRVFHAGKLSNVPVWLVRRLQAVQKSGRLRGVSYTLLDGHPTRAQLAAGRGKRGNLVSEHNVWCDAACGEQARRHRAQRLAEVADG